MLVGVILVVGFPLDWVFFYVSSILENVRVLSFCDEWGWIHWFSRSVGSAEVDNLKVLQALNIGVSI